MALKRALNAPSELVPSTKIFPSGCKVIALALEFVPIAAVTIPPVQNVLSRVLLLYFASAICCAPFTFVEPAEYEVPLVVAAPVITLDMPKFSAGMASIESVKIKYILDFIAFSFNFTGTIDLYNARYRITIY